MANRNSSKVYVQSKISIIADGQRGVTLSQVINAPPSAAGGIPADRNSTHYDQQQRNDKLKYKPVPAIADKSEKDIQQERQKHGSRHGEHGDSRRHKTVQRTSTKKPGHGKPSSVKSRNSSKKSKESAKSSSSSKYSEPKPVVPTDSAKDLAELLLEKLSSGSTVSSRLYQDQLDGDGNSTIRLSSTFEKSELDDRSLMGNVSNREDGSKKFTKSDGRPLNRGETQQQDEPSRGVRFVERTSYYERNRRSTTSVEKNPHQQQHVPLSVQLAVSDKYADEIKRDELAHRSLQKPRIPVKPDYAIKPTEIARSPVAQRPVMVDKSTQQGQAEVNNSFPTKSNVPQHPMYRNTVNNNQSQTILDKDEKQRVAPIQAPLQVRSIAQPGFTFDNTEVITIKMRPQSAIVDDDFKRNYTRSTINSGNQYYTGYNGKEYYTIV